MARWAQSAMPYTDDEPLAATNDGSESARKDATKATTIDEALSPGGTQGMAERRVAAACEAPMTSGTLFCSGSLRLAFAAAPV